MTSVFVPDAYPLCYTTPLKPQTDEFRMFCFKVLPCSKRYCHGELGARLLMESTCQLAIFYPLEIFYTLPPKLVPLPSRQRNENPNIKVQTSCACLVADWTTCPFAHPGEKAKRRDPRVHTYTGVACPDMKKVST